MPQLTLHRREVLAIATIGMSDSPHHSHHSVSVPHLLGVMGGALCISFAPIFAVLASRGEGGVGMWDSAFWRVALGAVAIGVMFAFQRKRTLPRAGEFQKGAMWIWLPGAFFAADFWAWHWSFDHTSAANSTLLANTSILWVTLFAWLVWKEQIGGSSHRGRGRRRNGVVDAEFIDPVPLTGGNLVFVALRGLRRPSTRPTSCRLSATRNTRRRFCCSGRVRWPPGFSFRCLSHPDPLWPGSLKVWGSLLGIGVLVHACGQGLIAYGLGGVPASLAAVTLLVQPVVTAIWGVVILGQPLVAWQIAGAVIVVSGLFLAIQGRVGRSEDKKES